MRLKLTFLILSLLFCSSKVSAINVQGDLTRLMVLNSGESFTGEVVINNSSKLEPATVKVYQTDAIDNADGSSLYGEPAGKDPRSNASWIKCTPEILQIPANGKGTVRFEGTLPKNTEGTYWCMLMLEQIALNTSETPGAKGMTIKIQTRYAARLVTTVKGTGSKKMKFLKRQLDEKKKFLIDIENTGSLFFDANLWVELFNQQGQPVGKFPAERPKRTYPGSSFRFTVDLSTVAPGKYTALCAVDAGEDNLFGARYQLEVK